MKPIFDLNFSGLYTGGLVPVARAILCVDCHLISAGGGCCPSCTSKSIIPLKPILGAIYGESADKLTEWLRPAEVRRNARAAKESEIKPVEKLRAVGGSR